LSADGLHYDHKIILNETTFSTPAVLVLNQNGSNVVVVAWAGTNSIHSLCVLYDVYGVLGSPKKQIFTDTSPAGPAMTLFNGQIWLAWAGTDVAHTLSVMPTGAQGQVAGAKTILWPDHSTTTPTLLPDGATGRLLLSWRNTSTSLPSIDIFQSADGANW